MLNFLQDNNGQNSLERHKQIFKNIKYLALVYLFIHNMTKKFTHYSKDTQLISIMSLCFALRLSEKEIIGKLAEKVYNFSRQTLYKIKRS
jgi:hypothetical protein